MPEEGDHSPAAGDHAVRVLLGIRRRLTALAVIAICAAFYFAQGFFLPVVLAIVLALLLHPIVRALRRLYLPAPLAAGVVVLTLAAALAGGAYTLAGPAEQWVREAPQIGRQLQFKLRGVIQSASAIGDVSKQVEEIAKGPKEAGVQEVVVKEPGLLTQAATGAPEAAASILLAAFLLYFLLATGDLFLEKLVRALPRLRDKVRAVAIAREIEQEISRYLLTVTTINIALGCVIGGAMALLGMPNPVLWGVMAALLNFIPYVGSVIGSLVVGSIALVTFNDPVAIVLPPLAYLGFSAIEGQLVTPMALGRSLGMNPVAIFLGVAF